MGPGGGFCKGSFKQKTKGKTRTNPVSIHPTEKKFFPTEQGGKDKGRGGRQKKPRGHQKSGGTYAPKGEA